MKLTAEELVYLEEPYVPHTLVGVMAQNTASATKESHVWSTSNQKINWEELTISKKLVAYFSASGTTAAVARTLAEAADADLYEIKPQTPYTSADLDWTNKKSRSSVEMNDKSFRPPLAGRDSHVEDYDTIFLGFPIWWYTAPTIVNTFLESYVFTGRTIILFATSGGSGLGQTAADLKSSAPGAVIREGKLLNGRQSRESLASWVSSLKI